MASDPLFERLWPAFTKEMEKRAAKVREARRRERLFPGAEAVVRFRSGGRDYTFARMPDGSVRAALNDRVLERPPKAVLRFARRMMAQQDVDAVHGL
jgi:hypothetical protein